MKAEHRKELQTNALADRMGRLVQGVKQGPGSGSRGVWVIAILTLVAVGTWYYVSARQAERSADWVALEGASSLPQYDAIAREAPGTMAGRTARFQDARLRLQQGLKALTNADSASAREQLERVRDDYLRLADETVGEPVLGQEAYLGAAKATEALGTFDRPSFDKALEYYTKVVQINLREMGIKPDKDDQILSAYNEAVRKELGLLRTGIESEVAALPGDAQKRTQLRAVLQTIAGVTGGAVPPASAEPAVADLQGQVSARLDEIATNPEHALRVYQKLADQFPKALRVRGEAAAGPSYAGLTAALRARDLADEQRRKGVEAFYEVLARFGDAAKGKEGAPAP